MNRKEFIKGMGLVAGTAAFERTVEAIPVIGDRYDAEQQKRVLG